MRQMGHEVQFALTLKGGLMESFLNPCDVVFLDVNLPDGDGLTAIPKIMQIPSTPEIIIITGEGDPDGAELAIKGGAWDYIEKTASLEAIKLSLVRALQYRKEKRINKPKMALKREGIVGESPQLKACLDIVAQAAGSNASVLITGETGTGKELFAKAIHSNSPRADNTFVVVDCAALPETLIESMLFGHEKGAFTGAERSKEGLVTQAHRGTLFLDEVGELPLSIQKAFLRVLQEHRFRPVGHKHEIESDFRLIAATNRDLGKMVKEGLFRKDLFFRLHPINIDLPPLRKHPEDINDLIMYYVTNLCHNIGTETKGLSPEFYEILQKYEWPGNVREFINGLVGAIIEARHEPTLFPKHLPMQIRVQNAKASANKSKKSTAKSIPSEKAAPYNPPRKFREVRDAVLAEMEKKYFQDLMELTKGSIKEACEISGLSRNRLYIYLKKHEISRLGWH